MKNLARWGVLVALGVATLAPTQAPASTTKTNVTSVVRNGDFEWPVIDFAAFYSRGDRIGAWRVTRGSVDVLDNTYWPAPSGEQSIDLAGVEDGQIAQRVDADKGRSYLLRFQMSGYPAGDCGQRALLVVRFDGVRVAALTTSLNPPDTFGWSHTQLRVSATTTRPVLSFRSVTGDGVCGPLLDDVELIPFP